MIYFVPIEFIVALILGTTMAYTIMRKAEYKFGRWSQIFAMLISPFIVMVANQFFNIPLFAHFSIGGHNSGVVIGIFLLVIEMIILNTFEIIHWFKNPEDKVNPDRSN